MQKLFILTLGILLVSCSHHGNQERSVASEECLKSVKGQYQTYFESVENCIEKEDQK